MKNVLMIAVVLISQACAAATVTPVFSSKNAGPRLVTTAEDWMMSGVWDAKSQSYINIKHLNPVDHTNNWGDHCLLFVRSVAQAAHLNVSLLWQSSPDNPANHRYNGDPAYVGAQSAYYRFQRAGRIHQMSERMPIGAIIFFAHIPNYKYGHVVIFTGNYSSDGQPIVVTTGSLHQPGIAERSLDVLENHMTHTAPAGWATL